MSFKAPNKKNFSIAFRLSFLYASVFAISLFLMFFVLSYLVYEHLSTTKDEWILEESIEVEHIFKERGSYEEIQNLMEAEAQFAGTINVFYCMRNREGEPIVFSDPTHFEALFQSKENFPWTKEKGKFFETTSLGNQTYRVYYLPLPSGEVIQHAVSLNESNLFMEHILKLFTTIYIIAALIYWAFGFLMVKYTLRPVLVMSKIAREFSIKNLDKRIPVLDADDELSSLAITLNEMLDRIKLLLEEMNMMNDNLAHDLRTLVSRIRVNTEVSLLEKRSPQEYRAILGNSLEECDHLINLLNTLLDISEVEAGILFTEREELDLDKLVTKTIEVFRDIESYRNIAIFYEKNSDFMICGHFKKLQEVLINLLDNAFKYTKSGGSITITVKLAQPNYVSIQIQDTGIGIPEEAKPNIFKRFFRADEARTLSGSGLGLSLSKAIIEAHNGSIEVESQINKGSTFKILLPLFRE